MKDSEKGDSACSMEEIFSLFSSPAGICCLGGIVLPNARLHVGLEGCACFLVCLYVEKDANLSLAAV